MSDDSEFLISIFGKYAKNCIGLHKSFIFACLHRSIRIFDGFGWEYLINYIYNLSNILIQNNEILHLTDADMQI